MFCEFMHKSFSNNWCSNLSCITKNWPYLSSGLLICAMPTTMSSSPSDGPSFGCVSSLWRELAPLSSSFFSWGFTITCSFGMSCTSSVASSSSSSISTSSAWSLWTWTTFFSPAIQTYPASFVDVWNSPALRPLALVLARAAWWNASCWKNWL